MGAAFLYRDNNYSNFRDHKALVNLGRQGIIQTNGSFAKKFSFNQ
jgi:hypothetical protein